jgi:hypothetical protein
MLLRHDVLAAIASGRIEAVYRKWASPRVKEGSTLRTPVGVLEVMSVEVVDPGSLRVDDAIAAGLETVEDLLDSAGTRGETLYRIRLRHAGPDPRETLRQSVPDDSELAEIQIRLDRLDASSGHGPWTGQTLRLIAENPGLRAEDLARAVGREKMPFKLSVRKLKELGLTESLTTGYRLSPRGESVLRHNQGRLPRPGAVSDGEPGGGPLPFPLAPL